MNGSALRATGITGLSVVSENPVYVQGDWNAAGGSFAGIHSATAVMADAVTLLSNNWSDITSFTQPYAVGNRNRARRPGIAWRSFPERASPSRSRLEPRPTSAPTAARTTSCVISRMVTRR